MTRFLSAEDITELATHTVIMEAATAAARAHEAGRSVVAPRLDLELTTGFFRVMPGAVDQVMGVKVMTNVEGLGNRYLLLLYQQSDGELLAMLDADEVTRLRTAATTAVAAQILQPAPQTGLGMIGSGFEATGHLRTLARVWPLTSVAVHSPSRERREGFARRMSDELGIEVRAVATAREACAASPTLVLATKSREPVLNGSDLQAGMVVLSIGSTRPDLRELDRTTLARSAVLLVDDAEQVMSESGDIMDALEHEALEPRHLQTMGSALASADALTTNGDRDVLTFKSVGTAVQDLSLAAFLHQAAKDSGAGRELGELTRLKRFSANSGGSGGR
ncbi:MAG TPA: hypothetical protein VH834_02595 [Solirubrobacteraceae bacterium]